MNDHFDGAEVPDDRTWVGGTSAPRGPDETIRNYRVLATLGEGGMGVVYDAEQVRPVRRRVALKVVRHGMESPDALLRFESERQALARMDHPSIARVYEAGVTEQGRPFFAMERVAGEPITTFCDRRNLSIRERLELFMHVCEGVQHAHQKGIIHRDLKPSNVLVTDQDGKPVPKIIDFGVAKTISEPLTDHAFETQMGQLVGTLQYMSPEQADMRALDVDTRTDVYLLGMMLYELLTGELPFDPRSLEKLGLAAYRRRIVEEEPRPPSACLAAAAEPARKTIAARRAAQPAALLRAVAGDLDWITLRALEKERARRYAAASELAADVARHLHHEPVLASPPGNLYRVRKFARRHRAGVIFGGSLLLLLTGFVGVLGVYTKLLARARDQAQRERDRANLEAQTSGQVSNYLVELFRSSDPSEALGETVTAREILDQGREDIAKLETQPLVQARMMRTMGEVYMSAGLHAEAQELLEQALRLQRAHLGPEHLDVAETMTLLAGLLVNRGEYERVRALYESALAIQERQLDPHSPVVASSLTALGNILHLTGRTAEAVPLHERALRIREKALPEGHPDLAVSLANLATDLERQLDYSAARSLRERARDIWLAAHGPSHPRVALAYQQLGGLSEAQGDLERAAAEYEQALELRRNVYGADHPLVAESLLALAIVDLRRNDRLQAAQRHAEALRIREEAKLPEAPTVLCQEAGYEAAAGRGEEALALLRRAVAAGYSDADGLRHDPHFVELRDDREFVELLAALERGP